jgi:hypothetical protein
MNELGDHVGAETNKWKRIWQNRWVVITGAGVAASFALLIIDSSLWRLVYGVGIMVGSIGFVIELVQAVARDAGVDLEDEDQFNDFLIREFRDE